MLTTTAGTGFVPDPALPARDVLLDADAVRDRLAIALGVDGPLSIGQCVRVRAKYRIGQSLRVVYRLELGDRQCRVAARAFPAGDSGPAYRRGLSTAVSTDRLHPVLHDPELAAVWWTFPNDRRLRGVSALLRPPPDVADLVRTSRPWQVSEVVEYAPERSVTLRAADVEEVTVAYAKGYAPATTDVAQLAARYRRIAAALEHSAVPVSAPVPLGWCRRRNLLLLQAMPGLSWGELEGGDLSQALRSLGAAIATLHSTTGTGQGLPGVPYEDPAAGLARFRRLDLSRVRHSAELIGRARPDVAPQAMRVADRLAAGVPDAAELVLLHGDCHPKNALLDGPRVALVDLDQAGVGPAAADIGSLLARLQHGALLGEHASADAGCLGSAFLDGYATVRALPAESSLRWHTAAALLAERAMRAVNRVHTPALDGLGPLLQCADGVLSKRGPR